MYVFVCVCVCVCVCVADVKEETRHLDQSTVRQGRGKLKIFLNLKRIFGKKGTTNSLKTVAQLFNYSIIANYSRLFYIFKLVLLK